MKRIYIGMKHVDLDIDYFSENFEIPYFKHVSPPLVSGISIENGYTYGCNDIPDDIALIFLMQFGEYVIKVEAL